MYNLAFLISTILLSGSLEGWVDLAKKPSVEEQVHDVDPSIWVLFYKKMGSEEFSVRFPVAPTYLYEEGKLVVHAENGDEVFELIVSDLEKGAAESDEKWAYEKTVRTDKHVYHLRGQNLAQNNEKWAQFFSSFSILS